MNFIQREGDSSSVPPTLTIAAATTSSSLPAATGGDKDKDKPLRSTSESGGGSESGSGKSENGSTTGGSLAPVPPATSISLICVTGEPDFDVIRVWGENVTQVSLHFLSSRLKSTELNTWQRLEREGSLEAISNAIRSGYSSYSVSELGIPGLRHFFYKSRPHVQVTGPEFEEPYEDLQERRRYEALSVPLWINVDASHRLITLYQLIQDAVHAKSGQEKTLKLQYLRTEKEGILGWVRTSPLFVTDSPTHLPRSR